MYNDVDYIIFYIVRKTFLIDLEVKSTSVRGKCTPGYLFSLKDLVQSNGVMGKAVKCKGYGGVLEIDRTIQKHRKIK